MSEYNGKIKEWYVYGTPLEALDSLMGDYVEMCYDIGDNGVNYQLYNLTSQHHVIRKALLMLRFLLAKDIDLRIVRESKDYNEYIERTFDGGMLNSHEFEAVKEMIPNG